MDLLDKTLKKNIVFFDHNLASNSVFYKMYMIVCRNVLIYINRSLRDRILKLFSGSLSENGFLCLGLKETIRLSSYYKEFEDMAIKEKIYRKR